MKQKFGEYYIGLDIGTNSVGWAVTDLDYNVLRFNKKSMWGVRLFQDANTAEERRQHRAARRRLNRRKYRIQLLQELFSEEISKVDPGFYQRLEDSAYHFEDKRVKNKYSLFVDKAFTDKEFFDQYPTIFHLRKDLIDGKKIDDIRLLYLAIHNIIKKRGHFIFEGQDFKSVSNIDDSFNSLRNYLNDELDNPLSEAVSNDKVAEILNMVDVSNKDKESLLSDIFDTNDKCHKNIFKIIVGNKGNFKDIFSIEEEDKSLNGIKFSAIIYDEKRSEFEGVLGDKIELIDILKEIYDWSVLSKILSNNEYLSYSMVEKYNQHRDDLVNLKKILKKYSKNIYKDFFKDKNKNDNYNAYINHEFLDSKNSVLKNVTLSQEDISKKVLKILKDLEDRIEQEDLNIFNELIKRADKKEIFPKQRVSTNGVIPYQIHRNELVKILDNYSSTFSFLNNSDSKGLTVKDKIVKLIEFRIPYYVGPLNNHHLRDKDGFSWVVRKQSGRVTPWNFDEKIDKNASAEKFITNMTNKCTYLVGEDVIPKDSLLYSEFKVLNEINNIKLDGVSIPLQLKQEIFNELMLFEKRVTIKKLRTFFKQKQFDNYNTVEITGIDNGITSSLKTHILFNEKLEGDIKSDFNKRLAEDVVRWKCLYGEDKSIFKNKLHEVYKDRLDQRVIKELAKLKFTGWGRLSKKFLKGVPGINKDTGEHYDSIMDALYKTNNNIEQLLSIGFTFRENIDKNNFEKQNDDISYLDLINELYLPTNIKRSVNQTVKILEEIKKITGREPNKIFVEMARGTSENLKGKRTSSRKDDLLHLYKSIENNSDLKAELEGFDNTRLKQKKLFLYFKQLGMCMYSGKTIDINELFNNNEYDIDHIYPQSKVKDDSFDNLVLVQKGLNAKKSNELLSDEIRSKMISKWKMLYEKKLMSQKKFNRLTRTKDFSNTELAGFISRQLVETRQSTKAIGQIIPRIFPNADMVYLKAKVSSEFRKQFGILKVREMNNLHHAYDAYMSIVVGNVYDVKFTRNPINFIKNYKKDEKKYKYSLNRMYDFDVKNSKVTAWEKGKTEKRVLKQLKKFDINVTEMTYTAHGALFNETKQRKADKYNSTVLPLNSDKLKDTSKYGAYYSINGAYFFIVEHTKRKKRIKTIEMLPIYADKKIKNEEDLLNFSKEVLKLIEPKILIKKLPYYSKLIVEGWPCILTGKGDVRLLLKNTIQLVLDGLYIQILKDTLNFVSLEENKRFVKKYIIDKNKKSQRYETEVEAESRFSKQMNELYNVYKNKLEVIYKKRSDSVRKTVFENENIFKSSGLYEKAFVLRELTKLFSNTATTDIDLRYIGGSKNQGKLRISKDITDKKVIIVFESITGLFVQELEI